jgi:hypothetical protein
MKRPRTRVLLIAAFLFTSGTLVWAGCGGGLSSTEGQGVFAAISPYIATAGLLEEPAAGDVTKTYAIEASDARVNGTLVMTIDADMATTGSPNVQGSWVLTNSKGTWVCDKWTGVDKVLATTGSAIQRFIYAESKGTGEYEGLTLHMQWYYAGEIGPRPHRPLNEYGPNSYGYAISGWIQ